MEVFKEQMTEAVLRELLKSNIILIRVPANMIHIFQPLNLTVKGYFKQLMKSKFVDWYTSQIMEALKKGQNFNTIYDKFKLSTVK